MKLSDQKTAQILVDQGYVSAQDLDRAQETATSRRVSIIEQLFQQDLLSPELLGQAMAEHYDVPYVDLDSQPPTPEQITKIPEEIAQKYRVVLAAPSAVEEEENKVTIATDSPGQDKLVSEVESILGAKKVTVTYALPEAIDAILTQYRQPLATRFSKIIEKQGKIAPEIIEEIVDDALTLHASDIHFEPQSEEVVVRFRVDGILREAGRIPKNYYGNILNRIKVLANLRIDEHGTTQDGAIRLKRDDNNIDMRISIVPAVNGEKIVIRVLSAYVQGLALGDLGLSENDQKLLRQIAHKPFGMILVTGPTGSGKTTTLYALLNLLNSSGVNITTIEDPVEYKMPGTTQIQINQNKNLTFANGLRSIVRQDPDIILVGEIRDQETAEIAVNAALTGHLLLSTFHANNAATAIPRLVEMGVEAFLLSSTLELVIAQRLVRKLCDECKYSYSEKVADVEKVLPEATKYFTEDEVTLYKGKGCPACGGTGYKGRMAVFEFIPVTNELGELVLKNPSTQQIWQLAKKQGAHSLFEDGIEKVKNGVTTLEELLRVVQPGK